MQKTIFLLGVSILVCTSVFSQGYITAGGIRLGTEIGLTLQQQILPKTSIEGILQTNLTYGDATVTGLVEQHYPIITKNLNIYVGGGLHKTWLGRRESYYEDPWGVTLVGGAEITLGRMNVSWDFKPVVNIVGGDRKFESQTALSVRYVFIKPIKKKKKFNWRFWEDED